MNYSTKNVFKNLPNNSSLEENHCHPNPCRNSGVCTEADGAFVCTCSEGFKGINCEGKGK